MELYEELERNRKASDEWQVKVDKFEIELYQEYLKSARK
jgi:hypothetical protein